MFFQGGRGADTLHARPGSLGSLQGTPTVPRAWAMYPYGCIFKRVIFIKYFCVTNRPPATESSNLQSNEHDTNTLVYGNYNKMTYTFTYQKPLLLSWILPIYPCHIFVCLRFFFSSICPFIWSLVLQNLLVWAYCTVKFKKFCSCILC